MDARRVSPSGLYRGFLIRTPLHPGCEFLEHGVFGAQRRLFTRAVGMVGRSSEGRLWTLDGSRPKILDTLQCQWSRFHASFGNILEPPPGPHDLSSIPDICCKSLSCIMPYASL